MKRDKKSKNLFLMTPIRRKNIDWEKKSDIITLIIERDNFFDNVMNKIFKTPKVVKIELDAIGSFVWENCNGENNINDISKTMKIQFGNKVEPINERLVTYIRTLQNNKFIEFE